METQDLHSDHMPTVCGPSKKRGAKGSPVVLVGGGGDVCGKEVGIRMSIGLGNVRG